jgi:PKD repeat protein
VLKKASLCAIALALSCASLYAQLWPIPSYTTPDTPQACAQCPAPNTGLPTPGWHDPVQKFVGRYVSSEFVSDWQYGACGQGVRTLRAGGIRVSPDKSRIVVKLGNAIASYDAATFVSRLDAHEPLVSVSTIPISPGTGYRCGDPLEVYLRFDHFFNAEGVQNGWKIPSADGQDRLIGFDVDDRGYIYMGYKLFGFGVAQDSGNNQIMPSFQDKPSLSYTPTRAFWLRDGTSYYCYVERETQNVTHVFNVTGGITNVTELSQFPKGIVQITRGNNRAGFFDEKLDQFYIYDNHTLVSGGNPLATISFAGSTITSAAWDGTYWWVSSYNNQFLAHLTRLASDGTGRADFDIAPPGTSFFQPLSFRIDGGYAVLVASDSTGRSLHLYKIASGTPVEVPVPSIGQYYAPLAGFAAPPNHMALWSAEPLVLNGKLYIITSADGVGDVWQVRTDDGVTVSVLGTNGPGNGNAPARATGDIFYGDTVRLSSALSSGVAGGALNWNFGAPKDPANTQAATFGATILHQYSGLGLADVTSPLTVTATNPATGSAGTASLTLKKPTARVSFGNTTGAKTIVTLPGTGAPIVADDSFFDASDGDTTGHYTDWRIGADAASIPSIAPNYQPSTASVPVGGCGQHTLLMTAHYGYSTFAISNVDFPVSPAPANGSSTFTYMVKAFAAGVDRAFNSTTGNVEFFSTSRGAAALAGRNWTYVWDVVDANGTPVASFTPLRGTTTSVASVPRFPVAKSLFTAGTSYRGRLTLSVDGADPCVAASQAPMAADVATSLPVVAPDATLPPAICNNGICTWTVSSPSGVMQSDAWTFAWSTPSGTPTTGNTATQTVTYTSAGTFNVSVVVTNKSGISVTLTSTAQITTPASLCPTMVAGANVFATYAGGLTTSTCRDGFSNCSVGEPIAFTVDWLVYPDVNCSNRASVSWRFDSGAPQAAADSRTPVTATFDIAGSHTAECTVTIDGKSVVITKTFTIGNNNGNNGNNGNGNNGNGNNGNGGTPACGTMNDSSTYITYFGAVSGCRALSGVACNTSESVAFNLGFTNYNNLCATHTYTWSFDNGVGQVGTTTMNHTFAVAGTHTVTCTIFNGTATFVAHMTVPVTGSAPPPPTNACAALQPGRNVFLDYNGTSANCHAGGNCTAGESVTLALSYYQYDATCGTHTYTWKVDGATIGSGATATTTLTAGTHNIVCTVSNGGTPVDVTGTIVAATGAPARPAFTFDFALAALPTGANTYLFSITSITPTLTDAQLGAIQWTWSFGDGKPDATVTGSAAVVHTFPDDKQYTVTLKAAGNTYLVSHSTPAPPTRTRAVRH